MSVIWIHLANPGERIPIANYPQTQDEVRKHYIQRAPSQSIHCLYPPTKIRSRMRQFSSIWSKVNILNGWSIVWRKMMHIVYVVIYSNNEFFHGNMGEFQQKT